MTSFFQGYKKNFAVVQTAPCKEVLPLVTPRTGRPYRTLDSPEVTDLAN